jgi:hypothetical protein
MLLAVSCKHLDEEDHNYEEAKPLSSKDSLLADIKATSLENMNLDSLLNVLRAEGDTETTLEDLKRMQDEGFHRSANGYFVKVDEKHYGDRKEYFKDILKDYIMNEGGIVVSPNPTAAELNVELLKHLKIESIDGVISRNTMFDEMFPCNVTLEVRYETSTIVWRNNNPESDGYETVPSSALTKNGQYQLLVNIEGTKGMVNFRVVGK